MLRAIRERRKIEAGELAEMIGVGRDCIYRWERGETVPRLRHQRRLEEIFGMSTDLLLRPADAPQEEMELGGGA